MMIKKCGWIYLLLCSVPLMPLLESIGFLDFFNTAYLDYIFENEALYCLKLSYHLLFIT
jgi:hypothetical protein